MNEVVSYGNRSDEMSQDRTNQDNLRRVWVKRLHGTPTTILMSRDSIVDDLKSAVSDKYPNTLARYYDPADLIITLLLPSQERPSSAKFYKKRQSITRTTADSTEDFGLGISDNCVVLEPDQNVWDLLDEYYGLTMTLNDALIVDVPTESPQRVADTSHLSYPRSDDKDYHKAEKGTSLPYRQTTRQRSSQTNLHTPKPQYAQGIASLKNTTLHAVSVSPKLPNRGSPNLHKRSQSSPSPAAISTMASGRNNNSQAVLLLPKNFSLGEQQLLNKTSGEDGGSPRPSVNERLNAASMVSDLKTTESGNPVLDNLRSEEQSETESETHTPSAHQHRESPGTPTATSEPEQRPSVSKPEKTINTSTFEKVLPSISVLVVEDNSINQAILGAFLRKHKIHYQIAKNGQEAIDKWRKGGFHLVLMDIQLPVKSGIEATKEIRYLERVNRIGVFAQHELKNNTLGLDELTEDQKLDLDAFRSPVIIVALTASSNSSVDKTNALTAGCNDFLTKPVNLVWLQNKITEWGCMQALIDFDGWKFKGTGTNGVSKKTKK